MHCGVQYRGVGGTNTADCTTIPENWTLVETDLERGLVAASSDSGTTSEEDFPPASAAATDLTADPTWAAAAGPTVAARENDGPDESSCQWLNKDEDHLRYLSQQPKYMGGEPEKRTAFAGLSSSRTLWERIDSAPSFYWPLVP